MKLSKNQLSELKQAFESRFRFFAQTFCDVDYFDDALHGELCDFLQTQFWREEKDDWGEPIPHNEKVIILPRGFIKTTIIGLYLCWKTLKNPELRTALISNTATNAQKTVSEIMSRVVDNELVRALWPEVMPDSVAKNHRESWTSEAACLKRKKRGGMATYEAIGVGGNVIRRHWDIIVEDDTIAPKKDEMGEEEVLPTQDEIQKAINFHKLTGPLKVHPVKSERIVIGTRWADEDLLNHVVQNEGANVFDRPALLDAEGEPTSNLDTGIPTHPKLFPRHALKQAKKDVGNFLFMSLYLNDPQAKEFMSFKQSWIKYWADEKDNEGGEYPSKGFHRITVDPADEPTGGKWQDYSAIVSGSWNERGLFILRSKRERYTTKELVTKTLDMAEQDSADQIRLEVNRHAYLKAAFEDEMNRRGRWFSIDYYKVSTKKDARIMELLPLFESGRVWLHKNAHNMETELLSWPGGRHDDEIDALAAQCVDHVRAAAKATEKPQRKVMWKGKFEITHEQLRKEIAEDEYSSSHGLARSRRGI